MTPVQRFGHRPVTLRGTTAGGNDLAVNTEPTEATSEPAGRKRMGRPTDRDVPRTSLDAWIVAHGGTSQSMAEACAAAATRHGYDASAVPSKKSIDDMRTARFYPGLVAAFLISEATGGEVGLPQWARDQVKYGGRRRPAKGSAPADSSASDGDSGKA